MGGLTTYQDPARREDIKSADKKPKLKLKFSVAKKDLPKFYKKLLSIKRKK